MATQTLYGSHLLLFIDTFNVNARILVDSKDEFPIGIIPHLAEEHRSKTIHLLSINTVFHVRW
jgi:hypothetical protein